MDLFKTLIKNREAQKVDKSGLMTLNVIIFKRFCLLFGAFYFSLTNKLALALVCTIALQDI